MKVLAKIPKGAIIPVADALEKLLRDTLEQRNPQAWARLLSFSYWCLQRPGKEQTETEARSLATRVRRQVAEFMETDTLPELPRRPDFISNSSEEDRNLHLKKRVSAKFADGDIRGAVRELASSLGLAPNNETTINSLQLQHPPAPDDLSMPTPPDDDYAGPTVAVEDDIRRAISSFPPGSAGGLDGLRPGHLKALLGRESGEAGARLLSRLTEFTNMVLRGEVPDFVITTFFGASISALMKKDGGIRPIAVGNTLRRLATKVGVKPLSVRLGQELRPIQLGFSTKGGCEAAAHAARAYLTSCNHRRVLLKIDMRNAFNCIRRDTFLTAARNRAPGAFRLLWQAYSQPTDLYYGEEVLQSSTGIQQGDPFGPALFSLGVDEVARTVESEFNVWYLDDATLGDTPEKVLQDVQRLINRLQAIGLEVNDRKCELTILDHSPQESVHTESRFRLVLPNVRIVPISQCTLLGAPLSEEGIPEALRVKLSDLERMITRLEQIDSHQAFILLKNSFSIPKLQYVLRSSPAYQHGECLSGFDLALREAVTRVTNVPLDNVSWNQAALPVSHGGLGFRRAGDIALPAFISSMHSVSNLVEAVLSDVNIVADTEELQGAVELWRERGGDPLSLEGQDKSKQKVWDLPLVERTLNGLLAAADQTVRARLLAASCRESGLWLHAVPVPSLGTQLDPETLRISVALRVGAKICQQHPCRCGQRMDELGLHGLSCRYSAGRFPRHAALNDIVKRSLQRAGLPSVLEPLGLDRGDGKRPDGITIFPFKNGKSLCWDSTCVDTYAETHLIGSAISAGSAATEAETRKRRKYGALLQQFLFEPIALETSGVYGESTARIVKEIGRRLVETTGESRESLWFQQRLGLAVQRGNAFSILSAGLEAGERF